jgi:hypothetical protein
MPKFLANKLSEVTEASNIEDSAYCVRRVDLDNEISIVRLKGTLLFRGSLIVCTTCTCLFFTSSRIICSCACAAARFAGFNIDDPANIYPLYLVYNQPRYEDGCAQARLSPIMEYMPNYFPVVRDNGVNPCQEAPSAEKDMIAFNTQIFDALGTLDHLNEAARVVKFKELCASLQPVACQSALHFKHAAAAIIGCTNQLSSMQKGNTGAIRMSAIEKSRGRKAKDIFDNKSALRPSKKVKGDTNDVADSGMSKVVVPSFSASGASKTNCTTCRDIFKETCEVYAGHRSGSSKCPHRYHNPQVPPISANTNNS